MDGNGGAAFVTFILSVVAGIGGVILQSNHVSPWFWVCYVAAGLLFVWSLALMGWLGNELIDLAEGLLDLVLYLLLLEWLK